MILTGNLHLPSPRSGKGRYMIPPVIHIETQGTSWHTILRMRQMRSYSAWDNLAATVLGQWESRFITLERLQPLSQAANGGWVQLRSWCAGDALTPTISQVCVLGFHQCDKCSHVCTMSVYSLIPLWIRFFPIHFPFPISLLNSPVLLK